MNADFRQERESPGRGFPVSLCNNTILGEMLSLIHI